MFIILMAYSQLKMEDQSHRRLVISRTVEDWFSDGLVPSEHEAAVDDSNISSG